MTIFILMYILLGFTALLSQLMSKESARKFSWFAGFIILYLILALRADNIGTDLQMYIPHFYSSGSYGSRMESGYNYLNTFIFGITPNFSFFLAVVAFLSLYPVSILIKRYSKSIIFSYIIFASFILYHFMFSGLRQAIAIGIVSISLIFLFKNKLLPFIISVLIASTFHVTAIIMLIAYPLCNWVKMSKFKYILASIISLSVIFTLRPILLLVLPLVFGDGKYMSYIIKDVSPAYNFFIILVLIFLFTFIKPKEDKLLVKYRMLIFCAVLCQSLGFISQEATRIGYYFYLAIPLAIPDVISSMKPRSRRQLYTAGISAFMIFLFFYANGGGYLDVIPYAFFWE